MHTLLILPLLFVLFAWPAITPSTGHTVEGVCQASDGRTDDVLVRVPWTEVATGHGDVMVTYCVVRGEPDARLVFERDAEIVYFALATVDTKAPTRRPYTFAVRTSTGRVLRQGPAELKPLDRHPLSCRVEVCQFFTEPGERVTAAWVETVAPAGRR